VTAARVREVSFIVGSSLGAFSARAVLGCTSRPMGEGLLLAEATLGFVLVDFAGRLLFRM
jgi:hypothetical protein